MYWSKAPNTRGKSDAEQSEIVRTYKDYETVDAISAVAAIVFRGLEHDMCDFQRFFCRTEDRASTGARVEVGRFLLDSFEIHARGAVGPGRGVCRRLAHGG